MKMKKASKQHLFAVAFASAIAVATFTGCDQKSDAISQADQADKMAGSAAPGIAETKPPGIVKVN